MRRIIEQTVRSANGTLHGSSRIRRLTGIVGAIPFLILLNNPILDLSATPSGSHSVTVSWDGNSGPGVSGYRIYYGVASGNYTNSVTAGNVTTKTITGLAIGIPYYFAAVAYDASGVESDFSTEIAYMAPGGLPAVYYGSIGPTPQVILTVDGEVGSTYNIQASIDLITWIVIGTVTFETSGSASFTDTDAASFPRRYYRTHYFQP